MNDEKYIAILKQDFPIDFADDDPFTSALLNHFETRND